MRFPRHLLSLVAVLFTLFLGATVFVAVLVIGDWLLSRPETPRTPAVVLTDPAAREESAVLPTETLQTPPPATATVPVQDTPTSPAPTASPTPEENDSFLQEELNALLMQMTLEEKVGQMILSGITGSTLTDADHRLVAELHLGGVVYFARNTLDPEQTRQLSADLQAAAMEERPGIPLLIAIDHEGGRVFRFQSGMTHFPPLMALGATGSPDLVYQAAAASAGELRFTGINMDLAPVLDVNDEPLNEVISLRSFGSEPEFVAWLGGQYQAGLLSQGIIPVSKHFPGHGSTSIDSHSALPTIEKSLAEMLDSDLVPFEISIQNEAAAVMIGHLANLQIDPGGRPATLSSAFVQDLLRDQLGFEGVVISDAMSMGAIVNTYGIGEASVQAVEAGCDLLAYARPGEATEGYYAVLQAAQEGRIPIERIDAAVRRLLQLKQDFHLITSPLADVSEPDLQEHQALALDIARRAIAYQGNVQAPLLDRESLLLVSPDKLPPGIAGNNRTFLGEILAERGYQVEEWVFNPADAAAEAATLLQAGGRIAAFQKVILVMYDALLNRERLGDNAQLDFIQTARQAGVPVIAIAASSPYDLTLLPGDQPALVTFGSVEVQIEALVDALLAEGLPAGVMPVALR